MNYYSWGSAGISHILRNPFYKGTHLVCRTHQKGIRSNTYDIIPHEEWEVLEGCHEAIISPVLLGVSFLIEGLIVAVHVVLFPKGNVIFIQ